jgi:hypothetical protein
MMLLLALLVQTKVTQASGPGPHPGPVAAPPALAITAVRAAHPPVIDGKDDDDVWRTATVVPPMRQWQPTEDAPARYRTEAKVAYDEHNVYVFVRAYDPHPDSILKLLARRDTWTATDRIGVMIDSYHDRRSGFEFWVNPAGVKIDMALTNDGNEDMAWDGVWDAATTIDSLGWTAEYRIPLSQLRYPAGAHTFGFAVWRDLQRYTEREAWPVLRRSRPGFVSQFGELNGLEGLGSPRRLEITPYAVTKNVTQTNATDYSRLQRGTLGADIKYGLTPNLTLDATVNPDFGQVEADPSVLNLGAFETFFQERRPFFIEGTGIFHFDVDCSQVNCSGEGLFYSRRIGRSPQLSGYYGDASSPTASTILGASKLTGRLSNGLSIGLLDAVTQRAVGPGDATLEPTTNYFATRLQQDFRKGESGIGGMLTWTDRSLDQWSDSLLRRSATVGALDFRHRFLHGMYQISGSLDASRVEGTPQAIAATQRDATHYYQRPDGGLGFDSTRTSLEGNSEELKFAKTAGQHTNWETSYFRRSPGFEINDMGILFRADVQQWNTWLGIHFNKPTHLYRQANWNLNWWQWWNASGMAMENAFNTNTHMQLANRWWVHVGGTLGQLGSTFCDRCSRGGPAIRQDPYFAPWAGLQGDDRHVIVPSVFFNYNRSDGGRSVYENINPQVTLRVSSRISPSVSFGYTRNRNDTQPLGIFTDTLGGTHYTFAHLEQTESYIQFRVDYTLTRVLSLQVYAEPFVSKGTYSNWRETSATPRATAYDARYQAISDTGLVNNNQGFNVKAFNSNVVLRWEYRPGSTLFLVWTQGRSGSDVTEGNRNLQRNFGDILGLRPDNTFLVKASYWLSW